MDLIKLIDAELLLLHPCPQSLRSRRAQKRTQEAAGIGGLDQSISQKPKLKLAVSMDSRAEEAGQENVLK